MKISNGGATTSTGVAANGAAAADDHDQTIGIRELEVVFNRGSKSEVVAVSKTNFDVGKGEIVCLLGPSGCGKSTILNVVAGLVDSYDGGVLFGGQRVADRGHRVGYMFQQDALLPWLTTLQNVVLPMQVAGKPDDERARTLIEIVQLSGFEDHLPHQLSGGMRKRVQLARLLAQDPEFLLLDEPFGALDAQTRLMVQQEFLYIWERRQRPTLFVTHDLGEAIVMGDRILVMSRRPGRIKAEFRVDLPRPRTVTSLVGTVEYQELFSELWSTLEEEVGSALSDTTSR